MEAQAESLQLALKYAKEAIPTPSRLAKDFAFFIEWMGAARRRDKAKVKSLFHSWLRHGRFATLSTLYGDGTDPYAEFPTAFGPPTPAMTRRQIDTLGIIMYVCSTNKHHTLQGPALQRAIEHVFPKNSRTPAYGLPVSFFFYYGADGKVVRDPNVLAIAEAGRKRAAQRQRETNKKKNDGWRDGTGFPPASSPGALLHYVAPEIRGYAMNAWTAAAEAEFVVELAKAKAAYADTS